MKNLETKIHWSRLIVNPVVICLMDAFLVKISLLLACHLLPQATNFSTNNLNQIIRTGIWLGLATILVFWGLGLYEKTIHHHLRVLSISIIGVLVVLLISLFLQFSMQLFPSPTLLLMSAVFQSILTVIWRFVCWLLETRVFGLQKVLIIGLPEDEKDFFDTLAHHKWFSVKAVSQSFSLDLIHQCRSEIDAVLLMPSLNDNQRTLALIACQEFGLTVYQVPTFCDIIRSKTRVFQMSDLALLEIERIGLTDFQKGVKRSIDIIISSIGLLLATPFMVLFAILIRATSPGPMVIRQARVGKDERVYFMYKFRTMVQDAEKYTGPVLSSEKDTRVTMMGKVLRMTRMDELPQLINVLKGEMSFVGPRPERPFFVEKYTHELDGYRFRHLVKPGITGLAQIRGNYTTSPEDKLRFDLYYIRNYSFLMDFKIFLQTIPVVLYREGVFAKQNCHAKNKFILTCKEPPVTRKQAL